MKEIRLIHIFAGVVHIATFCKTFVAAIITLVAMQTVYHSFEYFICLDKMIATTSDDTIDKRLVRKLSVNLHKSNICAKVCGGIAYVLLSLICVRNK